MMNHQRLLFLFVGLVLGWIGSCDCASTGYDETAADVAADRGSLRGLKITNEKNQDSEISIAAESTATENNMMEQDPRNLQGCSFCTLMCNSQGTYCDCCCPGECGSN